MISQTVNAECGFLEADKKGAESNVNHPVSFSLTNRPAVRGLCIEK